MPFCELWGCFVIDKTRKVKFLYNIIRFPLWRKTTIQLEYTETHKKKGASQTYDTPSLHFHLLILSNSSSLLIISFSFSCILSGRMSSRLSRTSWNASLLTRTWSTWYRSSNLIQKKHLNLTSFWYRFKCYDGTDSSDILIPIQTLRWYRFADIIRYKMNLGSNVSLWISLLPKISNAPLVCCLPARLRGLLSLVEWTVFLFALQS